MIFSTIVFACEDISYDVYSISKDETGCFESIAFIIEKVNCENNCFNFNEITFNIGSTQEFVHTISNPSVISNPFRTIANTIDCSEGVPFLFNATFEDDNETCNLSFLFEEEYQAYLQKIEEQKCFNNILDEDEEDVDCGGPCEECEVVVTVTKTSGDSSDDDLPSGGGSGGVGSIDDDEEIDEIIINQTQETTKEVNRPPVFVEDSSKVYVPPEVPEKQKKGFPLYFSLLITLIIISAIAAGFFILKKK